jgi:uncharacterized protein (DUF2147 family)
MTLITSPVFCHLIQLYLYALALLCLRWRVSRGRLTGAEITLVVESHELGGSLKGAILISLFAQFFLPSRAMSQDLPQPPAGELQSVPLGRWKTVDDASGRVESVVVIWQENGKLYGKIAKLIDPDPRDSERCVKCTGELKNRPLVGLRILWNLSKNGDQWSGGQILDPGNGKVYSCSISLEDGGKRLKVRGFIGFSWLGRTEHWLRDE